MRIFALLSFVSALVVAGLLLVVPAYSGVEAVATSDGHFIERTTRTGLLEVVGPGVLVPLLFPAVVAAATLIPLPSLRLRFVSRATATAVLGAFVFLTGFSIGLFYAPSTALMAFATGKADEARRGTTPR